VTIFHKLGSKIADASGDYKPENLNTISANDESNDMNSSSLNSSVNFSQLNKTARVQYHMSIFQRNYSKLAPIFRQMISMLVKESGEPASSESPEIEDCKF
jgi:hypothetical protein